MTNTHRALSSQMWVYNVIIICCKCCKYDRDQKSEEEKCVKSLWHSFKVAPVIVAFFQSGAGKIIKNDFIIVALNQWEHRCQGWGKKRWEEVALKDLDCRQRVKPLFSL